ncbi:MAG: TetR/AcrR family transcriptional regulator [Bacillota bacterium]|uniref:TetR/AcrR family transcriptional regulator n=1 Tax=Virgibacillus salarius TaxID=447199 RepID=A0A941IBJ2_9BACI|nr:MULTISPECIES: TetR/AcrR family transcriptional regulator [Bacillaceae]NAZ09195.1 TetR family transcriptional regulator [Agaribacter marinus]MBR7796486.1 TetR/AcrR family transcriptional regulator [Virgibacillus salarius]MCC2249526.1 TetR/AcrR family transcriptional regulator [Virgibacillus sp. AGTR]MDY7046640.1 TetR/AcrR family transcriptional regulator [Virgibacillus sp. M23]QRZ19394.1 TetR/AcrR family transcriptional regulator [Virgibacillus sp. AGTR]
MDGFKRRRELKKSHILEAALSLFMDFGVQKVAIKEIATKANVSQVTIYNYFGSKDNLVQEVIKHYINKAWWEFEELFNSDLPFHEKIKGIIFAKKETAQHIHSNFYDVIMKEYAAGTSYVEELYQKKALPKMMALFDEGRRDGFIDPNLSNESLLMYLQIFKEAMQREDIYKQILPMTEDIVKILFYGIVGKGES